METKVNYTAVGAFVILLLTAITLGIIWLSAGFTFQRTTDYLIYMAESVSGLSLDSPVEFNGVVVGNVRDIEINRKNPQLVEVILNINSQTPITRGTMATLNTRGITGITFISLKDKSTDLRPLKPRPNEKYAVIPTSPSLFMRLDIALKEVTTNIRKVTETFQTLFDEQNQQSIKLFLLNIQKISGTIAANSQKINDIFTHINKATEQFVPLIENSRNTISVFQTQTLPATYRVLTNLDELTRNLSAISVELKQNPSVLIRGTAPQPLGPGERK